MQYLQNCKCYDVYQDQFRKPLLSYTKGHKKELPKKGSVYLSWAVQFLAVFNA